MSVVSKYPYLGPRVRFLKSKLLDGATIKNLLFTSSLDEFLSYLGNTSYAPIASKMGKDTTMQEFALRIKENAAKEIASLARSAPFLVRMSLNDYLIKFEVENIKSIAKGLIAGMDRKSLEASLNLSVEEALGRRHVIADLMSASNLTDLADRLRAQGHVAHKAFSKAIELMHNHQDIQLALLDTLLESSYIEALTRYVRDDNAIKEVVIDMVDFYNLNILLRGTLWKLQPQVIEDMKIKYGNVHGIPPEDPGRLMEAVSQHPIIANILAVVRQATIADMVKLLHASYYAYMSKRAREVFGKHTEFSPGAALIIAHSRDLEGELVASIFNMVKLNISRETRQELFVLL